MLGKTGSVAEPEHQPTAVTGASVSPWCGHYAEGGTGTDEAILPSSCPGLCPALSPRLSKLPLNPPPFPPVPVHRRPQALHSEGSLRGGPCELGLAVETPTCSWPSLKGCIPQSSGIWPIWAHRQQHHQPVGQPGPATFLTLQVGPCQLQGTLEQLARDQSLWTLATEPGCRLLAVCMAGQRGGQ